MYQEATEAIESENFERSTVRILYKFYEMYYYNDVRRPERRRGGALGKSAGKTMEEASGDPVRSTSKNHGGRPLGGRRGFRRRGSWASPVRPPRSRCSRWPPPCRGHVAQMQAAMQEALAKGDMAEYMRLAQEFQQK